MDILTRFINSLNRLYSNKYFRFIFFIFVVIFVITKYSNVKKTLDIIPEVKINQNDDETLQEPKKVNIITKVQNIPNILYKQKIEDNEKRNKRIKDYEEEKKIGQQALENYQKEIEGYKEEFSKNNSNNKTPKIKVGDTVSLKMLMTRGNDFNIGMKPIDMNIIVTKDSNNLFAKYLIGKRKGDLILIPFSELMKNKIVKETINSMKDTYRKNNVNINLDTSNIVYRIKIVGINLDSAILKKK